MALSKKHLFIENKRSQHYWPASEVLRNTSGRWHLNKAIAPWEGGASKPCSSWSTKNPQLCLRTALLHVFTSLLIQVIYITHPRRATNTEITSTRLMKIRSSYLTVEMWRCRRIWCWWVEQGRWFLFRPEKVSTNSPDQSLQIKEWELYKIFQRIRNDAPKNPEVWVQHGVINIFCVQFQFSQHSQPFHLLCHWGLTCSTFVTGILCLLQTRQLHLPASWLHRERTVSTTFRWLCPQKPPCSSVPQTLTAISKARSSVVSSALTSAAQSGCSRTQQGSRDTHTENKHSEESGKTAWFMKSVLLHLLLGGQLGTWVGSWPRGVMQLMPGGF